MTLFGQFCITLHFSILKWRIKKGQFGKLLELLRLLADRIALDVIFIIIIPVSFVIFCHIQSCFLLPVKFCREMVNVISLVKFYNPK